jgi:cytochrome c5
MIFLFILTLNAMATEPEDKSEQIYRNYCASCHGENVEKIPLKPDSTIEAKQKAINLGVLNMPPYNWMLQEHEVSKIIKFIEEKQSKSDLQKPQ